MPRTPKPPKTAFNSSCGIARTLGILSDSWTFLILRSSFLGYRTFAEFRDVLGISTDVLSTRLATLVEHGILHKVPYQQAGQRTRYAYDRTSAGQELLPVLVSLQQWGEQHLPSDKPRRVMPVHGGSQHEVHVSLVDDQGVFTTPADARFISTTSS